LRTIARTHRLPFTLAMVLNMQATLALQTGDDPAALGPLVESARLAAEVGTTWTLVYSLPALAGVAARTGQPDLAATLFGAGAATAEATLLAVSFRPDADAADAQLAAVREQLPAAAFDRAWAHGRGLRIDELLEQVGRIRVTPGPA
jgi:hypothetical protein